MPYIDQLHPNIQSHINDIDAKSPQPARKHYTKYLEGIFTAVSGYDNFSAKLHEAGSNVDQFGNIIAELLLASYLNEIFGARIMSKSLITGKGPDIEICVDGLKLYFEVVDLRANETRVVITRILTEKLEEIKKYLPNSYEFNIKINHNLIFKREKAHRHTWESQLNISIRNAIVAFLRAIENEKDIQHIKATQDTVSEEQYTKFFEESIYYDGLIGMEVRKRQVKWLNIQFAGFYGLAYSVADADEDYWIRIKLEDRLQQKRKPIERNKNTLYFIAIIIPPECHPFYFESACWGQGTTVEQDVDVKIANSSHLQNVIKTNWNNYLTKILKFHIGDTPKEQGQFLQEPGDPYCDGGIFCDFQITKKIYLRFIPYPLVQNENNIIFLQKLEDQIKTIDIQKKH